MRVLLVEDDPMIGKGVQRGLKDEGYAVDWVRDGESAELALAHTAYELLLLDLGLPKKTGLDVLTKLRRDAKELPVLVVTARDAVADRVKGLDAGADDYLVKPFDLDELAARMRSVLRRKSGHADPTIRHGGIAINPATHETSVDGEPVALSTREFDLLHALLRAGGRVLSREQLEQQLYAWGQEVESNAVEVHIHHLRKKLGSELIHTVRGVGYAAARDEGAAP